jgi:hypothetical protein
LALSRLLALFAGAKLIGTFIGDDREKVGCSGERLSRSMK